MSIFVEIILIRQNANLSDVQVHSQKTKILWKNGESSYATHGRLGWVHVHGCVSELSVNM